MKLGKIALGIVVAGSLLNFAPALAEELTPEQAAGKVIFEETAGGVGCASCHSMDATGDVGPDIRGRTAADIEMQFAINENMTFIELTDEEIDQVASYLAYLDSL